MSDKSPVGDCPKNVQENVHGKSREVFTTWIVQKINQIRKKLFKGSPDNCSRIAQPFFWGTQKIIKKKSCRLSKEIWEIGQEKFGRLYPRVAHKFNQQKSSWTLYDCSCPMLVRATVQDKSREIFKGCPKNCSRNIRKSTQRKLKKIANKT